MRRVLLGLSLLLTLGVMRSHAQASPYSLNVFKAQNFTATGQTGATIQLNGLTSTTNSTVGSSYASATITLNGTGLTSVTFGVQGSSDNGVSFFPLPISSIVSPASTSTTVTAVSNGLYQINLAGISHVRFVTSGTFNAANVSLILTATPNGLVSRGNGGGGTGGGSVNSFASGDFQPLFTSSVGNPTTNPTLSFTAVGQSPNTFYAGPLSGSLNVPSFRSIGIADLPTATVNSPGIAPLYQAGTAGQIAVTVIGNTIAASPASGYLLPINTGDGTLCLRNNGTYGACGGQSSGGTVTSFSAVNPASNPFFTTTVTNASTTPSLTFALTSQAANCVLAGPTSGAAASPTCRALGLVDLPTIPSTKTSGFATVATSGSYNDLTNKPAAVGIPTTTAVLKGDGNGAATAAVAGTDYVVPGGTVANATGINGASLPVSQTSISTNGSGQIIPTPSQTANTFMASPSGAAGSPSYRAMTATDVPSLPVAKITGLAVVATSGSYTDLSNKPTTATLPTNLTGVQTDASGNAVQQTSVNATALISGLPVAKITGLATVATSGSYADLSSKPSLGTMASQNASNVAITGGSAVITSLYVSQAIMANFGVQSITGGTATSSQNYGPIGYSLVSSYWNGSAAASDTWMLNSAVGSGTNPTSTLTFSHGGTPGASNVVMPFPLSVGALTSSTAIALSSGGTGGTDAPSARASLGLATVAATGSYNDLLNKPSSGSAAVTGLRYGNGGNGSDDTAATAAQIQTAGGLGTASTANTGTSSGTVPLLGAGGLLPRAAGGTGEAGTLSGLRKANGTSADTAAQSVDITNALGFIPIASLNRAATTWGWGTSIMYGVGVLSPQTASYFGRVTADTPGPSYNYGIPGGTQAQIVNSIFTTFASSGQFPELSLIDGFENDPNQTSAASLQSVTDSIFATDAFLIIPNTYRLYAYGQQTSNSGTVTNTLGYPNANYGGPVSTGGAATLAAGATSTYTIPATNTQNKVGVTWVTPASGTGTFTVTIDNVLQNDVCTNSTTFTNGGCGGQTYTYARREFVVTPNVAHTVVLSVLSSSPTTVTFGMLDWLPPPVANGKLQVANENVIYHNTVLPNFAASAMNSTILAAINYLRLTDGLPDYPVDVVNGIGSARGINTTTDIATTATTSCQASTTSGHPNDCGYAALYAINIATQTAYNYVTSAYLQGGKQTERTGIAVVPLNITQNAGTSLDSNSTYFNSNNFGGFEDYRNNAIRFGMVFEQTQNSPLAALNGTFGHLFYSTAGYNGGLCNGSWNGSQTASPSVMTPRWCSFADTGNTVQTGSVTATNVTVGESNITSTTTAIPTISQAVTITLAANYSPTWAASASTNSVALRMCQNATGGFTFTPPSNMKGFTGMTTTASTCTRWQAQYFSSTATWEAMGAGVTY